MSEYILEIRWSLVDENPTSGKWWQKGARQISGKLKPEVKEWCDENLSDHWSLGLVTYGGSVMEATPNGGFRVVAERFPEMIFLNENDRLLFKLRWL